MHIEENQLCYHVSRPQVNGNSRNYKINGKVDEI